MGDTDASDAADARRFRWLLAGNGYFMEEVGLCGHGNPDSCDRDAARDEIDGAMQWQLDNGRVVEVAGRFERVMTRREQGAGNVRVTCD